MDIYQMVYGLLPISRHPCHIENQPKTNTTEYETVILSISDHTDRKK